MPKQIHVDDLAKERLEREVIAAVESVEFTANLVISPKEVSLSAGLRGKRLGALLVTLAMAISAYFKAQ